MPSKLDSPYRPMEYPVLAGAPPVIDLASTMDPEQRVRELEAEIEKKEKLYAQKLESARQEALERGKELASGEYSTWRRQCTAELSAAIGEFRGHADEYLARVEHEVVRLALAVAERVLRREAQMDPLVLSGAVRVALGQLAESTKVRLRIPAAHEEMWADMVRLIPELPLRPEVWPDQEMQTCEAILETRLGTVDLGVRTQLREIERSFFDLPEGSGESCTETKRPAVAGRQG
ncbi:MAG: FliH/SctL family protein [Acidobacteriaceae bacterium]